MPGRPARRPDATLNFDYPKSGGYAWMQSATALAGSACTKMKAYPVGELRLLGNPGRLNELCFCTALNCRFYDYEHVHNRRVHAPSIRCILLSCQKRHLALASHCTFQKRLPADGD